MGLESSLTSEETTPQQIYYLCPLFWYYSELTEMGIFWGLIYEEIICINQPQF